MFNYAIFYGYINSYFSRVITLNDKKHIKRSYKRFSKVLKVVFASSNEKIKDFLINEPITLDNQN